MRPLARLEYEALFGAQWYFNLFLVPYVLLNSMYDNINKTNIIAIFKSQIICKRTKLPIVIRHIEDIMPKYMW